MGRGLSAESRDLIARGLLRRVELPPTTGPPTSGRARLLRLDVRDLDALIDSMKGTTTKVGRRRDVMTNILQMTEHGASATA